MTRIQSQKQLEKISGHELEEVFANNLKLIEKLKIIIDNYDTNISELEKLMNEVLDIGNKFQTLFQNSLTIDYKEEHKYFGKNTGILDIYFQSREKEIIFFSTYEEGIRKVNEYYELEKKFIFFGSYGILPEMMAFEGGGYGDLYSFIDKLYAETNQRYLSGDVIVTQTIRTVQLYKRMSEIGISGRSEIFRSSPIPLKIFYKEGLERYERNNRKIELIKRSRTREKTNSENTGYVYVLSNEAYPNIFKIGSTYGLPEERAEELTGTGHLIPFKVVGKIKIQNAEYYEKLIHKIFKEYRVKKEREFFKINLNKIKYCFKEVSTLSTKGKKKITLSVLKDILK